MTKIIEQQLKQIITRDPLQKKRYIFNVNQQSSRSYSRAIDFPRVPIIHPYDPNGRDLRVFYDAGLPSFPVVIKFPGQALNNLTNKTILMQLLAQYNISLEDLEVFFCIQNMPWLNESINFRPHAWLDNNTHNQHYNIDYAVSNNIDDLSAIQSNISIHDGLFSPDNMALPSNLQDLQITKSIYSFCFNVETKRAAVTVHWLLNRSDYNSFLTFAEQQHDNLSLANIITWSKSLSKSNRLAIDVLPALGDTEIIYSESTRDTSNLVNIIEVIDDEPESTCISNPLLNNVLINNNIFNKEIIPHLTDSVSLDIITDPVFFAGVDETIYDRDTINNVIRQEREKIAERLRAYYDVEASRVIANTLMESSINFESPATRRSVNVGIMRSARLFIDVILIALYYANNIDVNNIHMEDDNLKNDLLEAINTVINHHLRRQAAETVLINAIERDLRNSDCGLTNHQLELLHDWKIINTASSNNRIRPRENDTELPITRRNLAAVFPDIMQPLLPSPSPNMLFQFNNITARRNNTNRLINYYMQQQEAVNNPLIARALGA